MFYECFLNLLMKFFSRFGVFNFKLNSKNFRRNVNVKRNSVTLLANNFEKIGT